MSQLRKIIKRFIPGILLKTYRNAYLKKSIKEIFSGIYQRNEWQGDESVSGPGSSLERTAAIRLVLPDIFAKYNVQKLLDLPCGDFNWFKSIDLGNIQYTGADIVDELIQNNLTRYKKPNVDFRVLDIIHDRIPRVDMIFCRDCLVHLPNDYINRAIGNIIRSRSRLLMTTSYISTMTNEDMHTGGWRPVNLEAAPFNFPKPVDVISEQSKTGHEGKSLCIWEINTLKSRVQDN